MKIQVMLFEVKDFNIRLIISETLPNIEFNNVMSFQRLDQKHILYDKYCDGAKGI